MIQSKSTKMVLHQVTNQLTYKRKIKKGWDIQHSSIRPTKKPLSNIPRKTSRHKWIAGKFMAMCHVTPHSHSQSNGHVLFYQLSSGVKHLCIYIYAYINTLIFLLLEILQRLSVKCSRSRKAQSPGGATNQWTAQFIFGLCTLRKRRSDENFSLVQSLIMCGCWDGLPIQFICIL